MHHGANMGVRDNDGNTPAHLAVRMGRSGIRSPVGFIHASFNLKAREENGKMVPDAAL